MNLQPFLILSIYVVLIPAKKNQNIQRLHLVHEMYMECSMNCDKIITLGNLYIWLPTEK